MWCTASRHWSHDFRELIKGAACPRRALKVTRIFNEKWNQWWVSAAGSLVWRESRSRCDELNPRTTEITHDHAKWKQGQRLPQGYRKETKSHLCPKSVTNKEFSSSVSRRKLSAVRLLSVRTWSARMFIVCSDVSLVREDRAHFSKTMLMSSFHQIEIAKQSQHGPFSMHNVKNNKDAAYQCECVH